MKKHMKIKVAVIDSGTNEIFSNVEIEKYSIHNSKLILNNYDQSRHGTTVAENILYECNYIKIISIKVLDENNSGKIDDLIVA